MSQLKIIPRIALQGSALDVISDVDTGKVVHDSFWASWDDVSNEIEVYKVNNSLELRSTIGSIDVSTNTNRKGVFKVTLKDPKNQLDNEIKVPPVPPPFSTAEVQVPTRHLTKYTDHALSLSSSSSPPDITTIDISPNGELLIAGTAKGGLDVISLEGVGARGTVVRSLKGHLLHTTKAKFFPSGQAAVSTGSDFQIKIWNIVDGSNPRTLTGHKGQIVDLGIIDRGRNIVSGSEDGTVKLWECGSGKEIANINLNAPIRSLTILSQSNDNNTTTEHSDLMFGVNNKTVAVALDSNITSWDFRSSQSSSLNIPVKNTTVITPYGENYLVSGNQAGQINVWDIRQLNSISSVQLSSSSEIDTLSVCKGTVIVSSVGDSDAVKFDLFSSHDKTDISSAPITYLSGGQESITSITQDHSSLRVFAGGKHSTLWMF